MEIGLAALLGILIRYAFAKFKTWGAKGIWKILIIIGTCLIAGTGLGLMTGAVTFANFSFETLSAIAGQIFTSSQIVYMWLRDRGLTVPEVDLTVK